MSKHFITVSLLIVLLSACTQQVTVLTPTTAEVQSTQPVSSSNAEAIPTVTATVLISDATQQPLPTLSFTCVGAPTPHVKLSQQVTVMADNSDKLKLRSDPKLSSDTVIKELDQFTQLVIAQGPFCVHSDETGISYWFWQVRVIPSREIGWVADGDSLHYYLEESTAIAIVNTPTTSTTCSGAPAPHVAIGQQVTVITENSDKLKLRELPVIAQNTEAMSLDKFMQLKILEGPACFHANDTGYSYWFWKVEVLSVGAVGWVAEGDSVSYFIGPSQ